MESEAISTRILPFVKKYWLHLSLSLLGLIFFIYGLIALFGSAKTSDIKFSHDSSASNISQTQQKTSQVTIDIEGQVVSPGVYKLNQGSILQDALVMAGGMSGDADREYIYKNINLALKLVDGQKIYIPKIGENLTQTKSVLGTQTESAIININSATSEALDTLPGIGQVTGQKIIDNRPYSSVNDLLSKKVVSSSVFTKIKDKIVAF